MDLGQHLHLLVYCGQLLDPGPWKGGEGSGMKHQPGNVRKMRWRFNKYFLCLQARYTIPHFQTFTHVCNASCHTKISSISPMVCLSFLFLFYYYYFYVALFFYLFFTSYINAAGLPLPSFFPHQSSLLIIHRPNPALALYPLSFFLYLSNLLYT